MLKLIVKCFIALRLKGLLVTAYQWSGQGNVCSHVCQSVCSRGVLTIQGPLPYHMATPRSQPPPNPYHMGPLLDLLKPIVGCLACKCSGEGDVFTHICLSNCLFTGGVPIIQGTSPAPPSPQLYRA